jgi:hypothetical protein
MSNRLAVKSAVSLAADLAFLTETPVYRLKTASTGLLPEMQGQIQGKCIVNARQTARLSEVNGKVKGLLRPGSHGEKILKR